MIDIQRNVLKIGDLVAYPVHNSNTGMVLEVGIISDFDYDFDGKTVAILDNNYFATYYNDQLILVK